MDRWCPSSANLSDSVSLRPDVFILTRALPPGISELVYHGTKVTVPSIERGIIATRLTVDDTGLIRYGSVETLLIFVTNARPMAISYDRYTFLFLSGTDTGKHFSSVFNIYRTVRSLSKRSTLQSVSSDNLIFFLEVVARLLR